MSIEQHAHNTNGRVKVEQAVTGAREAMQASPKSRVRLRKLLLPALLALGVIVVLRRFEQSTTG
jgi:hypothetical protein